MLLKGLLLLFFFLDNTVLILSAEVSTIFPDRRERLCSESTVDGESGAALGFLGRVVDRSFVMFSQINLMCNTTSCIFFVFLVFCYDDSLLLLLLLVLALLLCLFPDVIH
jgi:hypothetical protein